eukprot:1157009-Pelagomonas_calceolata.AAC.6
MDLSEYSSTKGSCSLLCDGNARSKPSQPLLQAIPKEQPSQPIGEDLECWIPCVLEHRSWSDQIVVLCIDQPFLWPPSQGDEVFDEAAGPELAEFMLAPEPLLPRDLRTPAIPPTQPLFGASTPANEGSGSAMPPTQPLFGAPTPDRSGVVPVVPPIWPLFGAPMPGAHSRPVRGGPASNNSPDPFSLTALSFLFSQVDISLIAWRAPNRPLRGPLLPPPLTKTTTTTSSSHYQRQGQLERSSHHHHTERRTLFGVPEEVRTAAAVHLLAKKGEGKIVPAKKPNWQVLHLFDVQICPQLYVSLLYVHEML